MTQPALFGDEPDPARMPDHFRDTRRMSRRSDPVTSHDAAAAVVASGTRDSHYGLILAALAAEPGMTSDEIARRAGLDRHAAARRLPELADFGRVRRGAVRRSRLTGKGGVTWWLTGAKP